jgi:peptidyl-dipeptidase Dcp
MVEAIFDCAQQLFGLTFKHRPDIIAYHPDVKTYEVYDSSKGTEPIAIFLHDNYARPNKHSGAWMNNFRSQSQGVIPIVINNNNFNKGSDGDKNTLLSFDDCVTLFHEFGHGLHGMLSECTYQTLSGTNVLRDFVELPSQLYEHWISEPAVIKKFAKVRFYKGVFECYPYMCSSVPRMCIRVLPV